MGSYGLGVRRALARFNLFRRYVEAPDSTSTGCVLFNSSRLCTLRSFPCCRLWQTLAFVLLLLASAIVIVSIYTTRTNRVIAQVQSPTLAQYQSILTIDPNPTCACKQAEFPLAAFVSVNFTLDFFCALGARVKKLCDLSPGACSGGFAGSRGDTLIDWAIGRLRFDLLFTLTVNFRVQAWGQRVQQ